MQRECEKSVERASRYEFVFPLFHSIAFSYLHTTKQIPCVYSPASMTVTHNNWHTVNSKIGNFVCLCVEGCARLLLKCCYILWLTKCVIIQCSSALSTETAAPYTCKFVVNMKEKDCSLCFLHNLYDPRNSKEPSRLMTVFLINASSFSIFSQSVQWTQSKHENNEPSKG